MHRRVYPFAGPVVRLLAHRFLLPTAAAASMLMFALAPAQAQRQNVVPVTTTPVRPLVLHSQLVIPASSQVQAGDAGTKAHTNLRYIVPTGATPMEAPPFNGYLYETPASIGCVYGLTTAITGCNPNSTTAVPTGGSGSIAVVDAFHDPSAAADLAYFSDQFGLPFKPTQFQIVYSDGFQPEVDFSGGWELEESLDIEWAHAMAPSARIYLVEAGSNLVSDLANAVVVAANLVRCNSVATCPTTATGKGVVTMSWGTGEFSGETAYDATFVATNVTFFASAGDSAGPIYPSTSPNVVSVGGTSLARSLSTGFLNQEIAWSDGGGGPSSVEPAPAYQAALKASKRVTPDVSADANPNTGVWVYDSFPMNEVYSNTNWYVVGGTSVSSPLWAGIVDNAGGRTGFAASSSAELTKLYADLASSTSYPADFHDITYGACYFYSAIFAGTGYDECTGIGSPKTYAGK